MFSNSNSYRISESEFQDYNKNKIKKEPQSEEKFVVQNFKHFHRETSEGSL